MIHGARGGVVGFLVLSSCACALAFAGGCSSDDGGSEGRPAADSSVPLIDGSSPQEDSSLPIEDASVDAADAAEASVETGCAAHPTAFFCDDFDNADALTDGKTKWDIIERSATQPLVTLSDAQAVSKPSSVLTQIIDMSTPGARYVKTLNKASFTEATWDYDVYLDNVGGSDGFFLDDFQFSDDKGVDSFGFRLVLFAKTGGGVDRIGVEHNSRAIDGAYVVEPTLPDNTVTLGKWHHISQTVKLKFAGGDAGADAGDGGANTVTYSLTVDRAATPTFTKAYPGISRAQAAFTRIAGLPYVFNTANSAGLKIHWDNHVADLK